MPVRIKKAFAVIFASSMIAAVGAAPAGAQVQDGLVNVAIGDINILNDARVAVAAKVAANVCGVKVGPVAVLGRAVDRTGDARTVCTIDQGPVTIEQNN